MSKKAYTQLSIDIPVQQNITYPIYIGEKILKKAGELIKNHVPSTKLLLVSNNTVFPIYGQLVSDSLKQAGFEVKTVVLPDGEDYKNIEWFKVIIDNAINFKLERNDTILALGGGVIGDMAGYAASSYLRGINLVQIATTLLAHVDSSIGGKVGINHSKGKNLIGAFYQPKCVIIDVSTLQTLDKRNIKNGLAEVLKYAYIEQTCNLNDENLNLFNFLKEKKDLIYKLDSDTITQMVAYCCKLKAAVVEQDEKESGIRAILNFGHTTGHALEVCGDYQLISHGEGVSIGIIAACRLAKNKNLINENTLNKAEQLIKDFDLIDKIPSQISVTSIMKAMKLDKKIQKRQLRFVLPVDSIGNVSIYKDLSDTDIQTVLKSMY